MQKQVSLTSSCPLSLRQTRRPPRERCLAHIQGEKDTEKNLDQPAWPGPGSRHQTTLSIQACSGPALFLRPQHNHSGTPSPWDTVSLRRLPCNVRLTSNAVSHPSVPGFRDPVTAEEKNTSSPTGGRRVSSPTWGDVPGVGVHSWGLLLLSLKASPEKLRWLRPFLHRVSLVGAELPQPQTLPLWATGRYRAGTPSVNH